MRARLTGPQTPARLIRTVALPLEPTKAQGRDACGELRMALSGSRSSRIHGSMRAEGEVLRFPTERVEAWARFDEFFQEEHERLFKAPYFVTGSRHDAEELMQDAFLKLWERWDSIDQIEDPTAYLFRVALNGFRMRRRHAAMSIRKAVPVPEGRDLFLDAEMRTDVRALLLELTPRQRAALLLVDLLAYPSEQAGRILGVRPSTVRALATQGRRALRAKEGARDA